MADNGSLRQATSESRFDVVIRGGEIIDGSGSRPYRADLAIENGKIARVGDLGGAGAVRTIAVEGLYVVPGFVDVHCHSERGLPHPYLAPSVNYLKQGVTTLVGGADGYGAWPIHETVDDMTGRLARQGIGVNTVLLVGSGQVRRQVMGTECRAPKPDEMARMRRVVREAMDGGAQGLSSGLTFSPGSYTDTEEVVELAREVAPYGGVYHTHMRDEADGLIEAVKEAIRIAEESGAVGVITHFKAVRRRNWGKVREACELIEQARDRGVKVYVDQFPFTDGEVKLIPEPVWYGAADYHEEKATRLARVLGSLPEGELIDLYVELAGLPHLEPAHGRFLTARPDMLKEMIAGAISHMAPPEGRGLMALSSWYGVHRGPGNPDERSRFLARLADPEEGAAIRRQVMQHLEDQGGPDNITIITASRRALEGKSLRQAAATLGKSVVDAAIQLALENVRAMTAMMSQEDVEYVMRKDYAATGSDGDFPYFAGDVDPMGEGQHIRSYSTFTTKIRVYALDRQVISLPHAIRSSTSLPAEILGWTDRGLIREGYWADVAVFDPETIRPKSSPTDIHQHSEGVEYVLVNGRLAIDQGEPTGELAGWVIKSQRR